MLELVAAFTTTRMPCDGRHALYHRLEEWVGEEEVVVGVMAERASDQ